MPHAAARRSSLYALRRDLPPHKNKPSVWLRLLVAALAGVALVGASVFVWRSRAVAPETVALTRGAVELTYDVDGLVVRREQVYAAPAAGMVRRLVADGQRVRVGSPIVQILSGGAAQAPAQVPVAPAPVGDAAVRRELDRLTAAIYEQASAINVAKAGGDTAAAARLQDELDQLSIRQQALTQQLGRPQPAITPSPARLPAQVSGPPLGEITATASGVVVYQTDGLEGPLDLARQNEWKPALVRGLAGEPRATGESVGKGDPVLKVVDNLTISLLAVVPEAALSRLSDSGRVTIRFAGREGPPVAARVTRQVKEGGDLLLVLTAPAFPEELVHQRRFRATLVLGGYEGLIVPRTAVDVRDGLQGVWVQDGAASRFEPVRVLGGSDELLALEANLKIGVRVLRNAPTWMR